MAESSLASPLLLDDYGVQNNDDITSLLISLAQRSGANGTLHVKAPSTAMTLKCGYIDFRTYSITKFAFLESDVAVTLQQVGNDSYKYTMWQFGNLYEFVVGSATAKTSRDAYLLTLVGTWTPSTRGGNGSGYNKSSQMIRVDNSAVAATGPLALRCHSKKPRGRGILIWTYSSGARTYPNATIYVGGTHHLGINFSGLKGDIHFENALFADPYCRIAGWNGTTKQTTYLYYPPSPQTVGVVSTTLAEFDCNTPGWFVCLGRMTGQLECAYGHPQGEYGFSATNQLVNHQFGTGPDDPFVFVATALGFSGPECAEWGWAPGTVMDKPFFNAHHYKYDGFGDNNPAHPSYRKDIHNKDHAYGYSLTHPNYGSEAYPYSDCGRWMSSEAGGDGSYGRIVSYIDLTLVNVMGNLFYNAGQATGYAEYIHHMTYRGDGANPAMLGGSSTPQKQSKIHLSIWDRLELARVYNVDIDITGGDSETTAYPRGCNNTILNCSFTGKLTAKAADGGGSGNLAENVKFLNEPREIIRVMAGGQLNIKNLYAPVGSSIVVESGATAKYWTGSAYASLTAGTYPIDPADQYVTDAGAIPADIPGFIETIQQVSRPVADASNSGWTSTKLSFYDALDEEPDIDYSDYIFTSIPGSIVVLDLNDITNPETFSLHGMQYAGDGNYRVELLQNGSVIATRNNYDTSPTKHIEFLSTTEAQLINQNYTNFQVRFTSL